MSNFFYIICYLSATYENNKQRWKMLLMKKTTWKSPVNVLELSESESNIRNNDKPTQPLKHHFQKQTIKYLITCSNSFPVVTLNVTKLSLAPKLSQFLSNDNFDETIIIIFLLKLRVRESMKWNWHQMPLSEGISV